MEIRNVPPHQKIVDFFPLKLCPYYDMDVPTGHSENVEEKLDWNNTKCCMCYLDKILEVTPHSTAAVKPSTPHLTNHIGHYWGSKDKLLRDILLWNSTHGPTSVGWPTRPHKYWPSTESLKAYGQKTYRRHYFL